jgi:hypothetical protein
MYQSCNSFGDIVPHFKEDGTLSIDAYLGLAGQAANEYVAQYLKYAIPVSAINSIRA